MAFGRLIALLVVFAHVMVLGAQHASGAGAMPIPAASGMPCHDDTGSDPAHAGDMACCLPMCCVAILVPTITLVAERRTSFASSEVPTLISMAGDPSDPPPRTV